MQRLFSSVACPAVTVRIGASALLPITVFAVLFAVVGTQLGEPVFVWTIFGILGGIASLLFHELGHVRAAARVPTVRPRSVSLLWAGAATTLEGRYRSGREQARVAIGGPRASLAFALSLIAVCFLPAPFVMKEPLLLLAMINLLLAFLNLLPAYPLDGYKLIAGLLWALTGSERKAQAILRRIGIGWAAIEAPAAIVLLVERPLVGGVALTAAAALLAQKCLLPRLLR